MELTCNHCHYIGKIIIKQNGPHKSAYCQDCGAFIKHVPKDRSNITDFELHFGKYKGTKISEMNTTNRVNYLRWMINNINLLDWQKSIVKKQIGDT